MTRGDLIWNYHNRTSDYIAHLSMLKQPGNSDCSEHWVKSHSLKWNCLNCHVTQLRDFSNSSCMTYSIEGFPQRYNFAEKFFHFFWVARFHY